MNIKENVGTFLLNAETITIIKEWGVRNISVLCISGTITVKGVMKLGARVSDTITLGITSPPLNVSFDFPIDGYTIDTTSGQALVITGR